ncbi:hypothetical protein ACLOJK_039309 [Asimina triloba]
MFNHTRLASSASFHVRNNPQSSSSHSHAPISGSSSSSSQLAVSTTPWLWGPTMAIALHLPTPSFVALNLPDKHRCRLHPRCFLPSLSVATSPPSSTSSFRRRRGPSIVSAGKEETELRPPQTEEEQDASPDDEERVRDIQRVLELLRKNRDMLFGEVKLTITIEDPREAERKRLLGIEESNDVTRDDLAAALEDVNEGRIPENRAALQMLHEEMTNWPNLEVEAEKRKPSKSLYARATDTGVDPKEAAKRLKIDWDSAAEIDESEESDELEVPPAVAAYSQAAEAWMDILLGCKESGSVEWLTDPREFIAC